VSTSEVKCIWVNCSEDLSNRVPICIRRYMKHVKFVACMAFLLHYFIFFWFHFYHCIYGCTFCTLLINFVNYVFPMLRLCILIVIFLYSYFYVSSFLCILFHFVVLCIFCV